jgi:tungstate transport system substrate-binding protein
MPSWLKITLAFIAVVAAASPGHAVAQEKSIVVASTTSPRDSGLFGYLLPIFKESDLDPSRAETD